MLHFVTPTAHDVVGSGILAGLFLVVFAVAEFCWRRLRVHTEITRKLVHAGGGLTVLLVPHLLTSVWSALALAVAFATILGVARTCHWLPSVHAIERRSVGAAVFPIAVAVCVIASRGRLVHFEVPLLALALGDTAAALVGRRFGVLAYAVAGTRRTIEGSAAFAVVTGIVAFAFFRLVDIDVGIAVLLAVSVGLVLAVVEAVSIGGWDNLTIPVAGLVVVDVALWAASLSVPVGTAVVVTGTALVVAMVAVCLAIAFAPPWIRALPTSSANTGRVS